MKKRSPTEILESRKNRHVEAGFARHPGKEFKDISFRAEETSVTPDYSKLQKGKKYVSLHTHPLSHKTLSDKTERRDGVFYGPNLPSEGDLRDFLYHPDEKIMYIAQQDPETGKVEGYYALKKTKRTPQIPATPVDPYMLGENPKDEQRKDYSDKSFDYRKIPIVHQLGRDLYNLIRAPALFEGDFDESEQFIHKKDTRGKLVNRGYISSKELDELRGKFYQKYGLKLRAVPAHGYYYEKSLGFKKKQSNLEHKIAAAFLFGISLVLLITTRMTGFVILDYRITNGLIIVPLILAVILALYAYFMAKINIE